MKGLSLFALAIVMGMAAVSMPNFLEARHWLPLLSRSTARMNVL